MDNRSKSDRIHDLLPRLLGTRQDQNWSALIHAIGQEDDRLANLIAQVRDQFFVRTASRPYLDRLAANNNISRPRFVGIGDAAFRNYIPVMSYQPKQVKSIIDTLLDIFFLKEATTAFLASIAYEPFNLKADSTLELLVDNVNSERIVFAAADFSSITAATAIEVVAAYNRQAKYSFATTFFDSVTKHTLVRIFTNTVGAQGSLEIKGGLANIGLQLNGFLSAAGTGANTQWAVTKVGDLVTFTHTGGTAPGLSLLRADDLFLCNLAGNEGSFPIIAVDVENSKFSFTNLFATVGTFTQTSSSQTKFMRPEKVTPYRNARRALAWETAAGQISVEMPTMPSVVQRGLKGAFHINGSSSPITTINSSSSLTVQDASTFPATGQFWLESASGITARLTGNTSDDIVTYIGGSRLDTGTRYTYSSISGNTLLGISPALPQTAGLNEVTITALSKAAGLVTVTAANTFAVGEKVNIRGNTGISILATTGNTTNNSQMLSTLAAITGVCPGQLITGAGIPADTKVLSILGPTSILMTKVATATAAGVTINFNEDTNGTFEIVSATASNFTYKQLGADGTGGANGTASVERILMSPTNSKVVITTARPASITKLTGPYVWDNHSAFSLSSNKSTVTNAITAGKVIKLLDISTNTMADKEGFVILDYGQNSQEGPIRYLYKPASNVLAIDPSYIFQKNHAAGCSIIALNRQGPHIMSGLGSEYAPYITNPSAARIILQDLIRSVASAGIFIDFLVRYPTQLYGTISVYD